MPVEIVKIEYDHATSRHIIAKSERVCDMGHTVKTRKTDKFWCRTCGKRYFVGGGVATKPKANMILVICSFCKRECRTNKEVFQCRGCGKRANTQDCKASGLFFGPFLPKSPRFREYLPSSDFTNEYILERQPLKSSDDEDTRWLKLDYRQARRNNRHTKSL